MKLLKEQKQTQVNVQITKVNQKWQEIIFIDTNVDEVKEFVKKSLRHIVDPFAEGPRTSIKIFNLGDKKRSGPNFGVYGISAQEAKDAIEKEAKRIND